MRKTISIIPSSRQNSVYLAQSLKVIKAIEQIYGHEIAINAVKNTNDLAKRNILEIDSILLAPKEYENSKIIDLHDPEVDLEKLMQLAGIYAHIRPFVFHNLLKGFNSVGKDLLRDANFILINELNGSNSKEELVQLAAKSAQNRGDRITWIKSKTGAANDKWEEAFENIIIDYPDLTIYKTSIEESVNQLIKNPSCFDVIITDKLFGDVFIEEAQSISGLTGLLPSVYCGRKTYVYEAVSNNNVFPLRKSLINSISAIVSVAFMMEHSLGMLAEANAIKESLYLFVEKVYKKDQESNKSSYFSEDEIGDAIVESLNNHKLKSTFIGLQQSELLPERI